MEMSGTMIILILVNIILLLGIIVLYIETKSIKKNIHSDKKETEAIINENKNNKDEIITFVKGQIEVLMNSTNHSISQMTTQVNNLNAQNDKKLEDIRLTMERRLYQLQNDNNMQLEKMRGTVDEKLQKTLEDKIGQSFRLVSDRLEQVYKGLGEMQTLASGVGDLKKVLTNVKNRGILGEIQLGAILEDILPKEQFETNVKVSPHATNYVEYAIKLPGDGKGSTVYLPIDAKFPGDSYVALRDAIEAGDVEKIAFAKKVLESTLKKEAKDISTKYIIPPYTTDFAIMFLPFEGLYAEAINMGLIETLQKEYKVNIAGPTTMAALLNSLQMGFRTLAIQKRSSQVWDVLGAVKNEFEKFETVIIDTQKRINQANEGLERLVGTRTRLIKSKLKDVTMLTDEKSKNLLEDETDEVKIEIIEE